MKVPFQTSRLNIGQVGNVLCAGLLLAVFALCSLFLANGSNEFCNGVTVLLASALLLILTLAVVLIEKPLLTPMITLVAVLALSFVPGMLGLLMFPDIVSSPLALGNVEQINFGLSYLCLGSVAFLGCFVGMGRYSRNVTPQSKGTDSEMLSGNLPWGIAIVLAVLGVGLMSRIPFWLGVTQYHEAQVSLTWLNVLLQLIVLVFDVDSITLLAGYWACRLNMPKRTRWAVLGGIALVYLVVSISGGSRGGLLRLLIFGLIIALVLGVRLKLSFRAFVMSVLCALVAAVTVFLAGTQMRLKQVSAEDVSGKSPLILEEALPKGVGPELVTRLAYPFFFAVQTTAHQPNEVARRHYFTFEYAAKNLANNLPGTLYPEAYVNTSRVFSVVYRGQTEEQLLQQGYFSEFYTAWGLAYLFFGHAGGLLALAVCGVALARIFVEVYRQRERGPVLQLWALYALPGSIVLTQGLDHTLWLWVVSGLRFFVSDSVLRLGFRTLGRYRIF